MVRGCVQLQWMIFEDPFNMLVHFMMIYKRTCPHHNDCSAVFDQKQHDPHAIPSLFTWCHPQQLFCFPGWRVLKRKRFAEVEEVKQKMVETQNGIKINEFKNYFEEWKNVLIDVLHQMANTLKVLKFKHVRINTQFFKNKFWGFWVPPCIWIN